MRSDTARSASSGGKLAWSTLTPMPSTTRSSRPSAVVAASARTPASLRPSTRTSLGQRMPGATPSASTATATARAPRKVSGGASATGNEGRSSTETRRLSPAPSHHSRPRRPRPARWCRAVTTVPSGAPAAASRAISAWVESTSSSAWMVCPMRRSSAARPFTTPTSRALT